MKIVLALIGVLLFVCVIHADVTQTLIGYYGKTTYENKTVGDGCSGYHEVNTSHLYFLDGREIPIRGVVIPNCQVGDYISVTVISKAWEDDVTITVIKPVGKTK